MTPMLLMIAVFNLVLLGLLFSPRKLDRVILQKSAWHAHYSIFFRVSWRYMMAILPGGQ